jgi:dihydropteroate synthase
MNGDWIVAGGRLVRPAPFCLAGIVNMTPDSFFDGNLHAEPDRAVRRALELLDEGAHLLDLGAESTRPGALPLGDNPEQACAVETGRLLPVLESLRRLKPDAVLCADTRHGLTAAAALAAGADVINDVSAAEDPVLLDALCRYHPGYVLMHGGSRGGAPVSGNPKTVTDRVLRFFEAQLARLAKAGLPEDHIVLDPGVGFGKTSEESAVLLREIRRLHSLGRPLYAGLSMKSLFGDLLGLSLADRGEATRVATALLAASGVRYHRVHDAAAAASALRLTEFIASPEKRD